MAMKVIVSLPEYDDCIVRIGAGVLDRTGEGLLGAVGPALDSVLVVSDGTAAPDAAARIRGSLADTGVRSRAVDAPAGRSGRTLEVAGELLDAFSQVGLTRRSCVVALGDSSLANVVSLAGALYRGGIAFALAPTTLRGLVAGALPGTVHIDCAGARDVAEMQVRPVYVAADLFGEADAAAPAYRAGLAEVARAAMRGDDDFFFWLLEHAEALRSGASDAVDEAAARAVVALADEAAFFQGFDDAGFAPALQRFSLDERALARALRAGANLVEDADGAALSEALRFTAWLAQRRGIAAGELADAQDDLLATLGIARLSALVDVERACAELCAQSPQDEGSFSWDVPCDVGKRGLLASSAAEARASLAAWLDREGR